MKNNKFKYFTEICTEEFIDVPCGLPDIEQIVSTVVECEVESLKAINSMKGVSYEGQYLSGKKLAVEIKLRQKILYVSEKESQSVHILENCFFQSAYIVIPCLIEGTDPEFLIKHKLLQCKVDVEDVFVRCISKRKIFKNLCLLINAALSPAYELCCSMHHNCKYSNIYLMHGDGSYSTQITDCRNQKNQRPVWSPLGREIAFITDRRCDKGLSIYTTNSGSTRQLAKTSVFRSIGSYCWSPDETKLFMSGCMEDGREIFSVCTNDTDLKQLTRGNGVYESYRPKCSPCGKRIAFIRSVTGVADIWIMDLDGLNCDKLTSCGYVKYFDWSPDGRSIVYICSKNGKPDQLFTIDIECMASEEICIDKAIPHKNKVLFSAEGSSFAFIGSRLDTDDVYIYDLKNNRIQNITNNFENVKVSDFVWSVDSDRIYYTANELSCFSIYQICLEDRHKRQLTNTGASKIELSYRPRLG